LDKIIISEKDYENIAKGIAFGSGIGIFLGLIFDNIIFFFSVGSVVGIIISFIYSNIKRKM